MENGTRIRLILWKAYKAMEAVDRSSIASTGLCLSDFAVLEILLHKGPLPVNTIGRKVLLTSGSITTAVDRLENRGLVNRRRDSADGRKFLVHLTENGRKLIEAAFSNHEQNLDHLVSVLTAEERSELVRLLKKVGRFAEQVSMNRGSA